MKLKILKEYLKDVPSFLWFWFFQYRKFVKYQKKLYEMEYDRMTSYTAFPGEYEEEIKNRK